MTLAIVAMVALAVVANLPPSLLGRISQVIHEKPKHGRTGCAR